jgi:predicted Zn-dependent peptidase
VRLDLLRSAGALVLLFGLVACASETGRLKSNLLGRKDPGALATPPAVPRPTRERLPNGMTVLLMPAAAPGELETAASGLVYGMLRLATGRADDPPGLEGLAEITAAALLAECGAPIANQNPWANGRLQALGAQLQVDVSSQWTDFHFRCPDAALHELLELFGRVFLEPELPESLFDLARSQQLDGLATPAQHASLQLAQLALGGQLGLGYHPATLTSLQPLRLTDVQRFHRSHYGSRKAVLALGGFAHQPDVHDSISRIFGSWPSQAAAAATPWTQPPVDQAQVLIYLNTPLRTTASVSVLLNGPRSDHPDFPALLLATQVIRQHDPALGFNPELRHSSRWVLSQQLAVDQVSKQLKHFRTLLERSSRLLSKVGSTDFEEARAQVLADLAQRHRKPEDRMKRAVELEVNGYPRTFDTSLIRSLSRLSHSEVEAAYARHLRLDRMQIFLQGDRSLLDENFSDLAEPTLWPVSVKAQPMSASAFRIESSEPNWSKVINAHGGLSGWQNAAILTCAMRPGGQATDPDPATHAVWEYPGNFRFDARPTSDQRVVLFGSHAWIEGANRSRPLAPIERQAWQEFARAFLPWVLMDLARDPDQVSASDAHSLTLDRADGVQLRLHFDQKFRVTEMHSTGLHIRYRNLVWQAGLLLPGLVEFGTPMGATRASTTSNRWQVQNWQVNPVRQPLWFEIPAEL